jgi:hypothetical protein
MEGKWCGMTATKDYDFGATLDALEAARKHFPEDSPEAQAINFAFGMLIFINNKRTTLREFLEWNAMGHLPASKLPFNAHATFATQEEVDAWRASGKARDGDRVIIGDKGYEVVDVPRIGLCFAARPLPEQLAAWEKEEDEEAPES